MKRTGLFLSLALATAAGLNACGSKDSTAHAVRPTILAKVKGDARAAAIKDQTGAISISGPGVFSPSSSDGLMDMDVNLEADDTGLKKLQTLSPEVENDLKTAQADQTYINLGCVGPDGKKGVPVEMQKTTENLKEMTVATQKDVTVYSATVILMCGKMKLPSRMKMSAVYLYLLNASPSADLGVGKWIVEAQSIYSRGTENTFSIPVKAEGDTALDLSVAKEIVGIKTRAGVEKDGGKLQLHVAKKSATGRSRPNVRGKGRNGLVDSDPGAAMENEIGQDTNGIEEDNGQQNENNI